MRNNSIRFDQQYADLVMQMLQRLRGHYEYPGTGIGLALVQKAAEDHGEFIWAEGEPGHGSLLHVYLPVG